MSPDDVSPDDVSLDSLDVALELAAEVALDAALLAEVDELALEVVDELAPEPPVELEVSVEPDGQVVVLGAVVVLLFAANLVRTRLGTEIAWLFIASMLTIGAGFAVFLLETTIAARAVRVRSELLQHEVDESD